MMVLREDFSIESRRNQTNENKFEKKRKNRVRTYSNPHRSSGNHWQPVKTTNERKKNLKKWRLNRIRTYSSPHWLYGIHWQPVKTNLNQNDCLNAIKGKRTEIGAIQENGVASFG